MSICFPSKYIVSKTINKPHYIERIRLDYNRFLSNIQLAIKSKQEYK